MELLSWQKRQGELIAFLETLRADGHVITPLTDKDKNGSRFLLKEIDAFTFSAFSIAELVLNKELVFLLG